MKQIPFLIVALCLFLDFQGWGQTPTLTTTAISSITATTANSGGTISSEGESAVTERGVCWSTSPLPTNDNTFTLNGSGIGIFTSSLTLLTPNTSYYVRAYATNTSGTSYGNEIEFITPPEIIAPSVGDGTVGNPFQIATWMDLYWLSRTSSAWGAEKYFEQTADITFPANIVKWDNNRGLFPIGSSSMRFSGSYNGKGYTITGLIIKRPTQSYVGLFGYTSRATIINTGLLGCSISGNNFVRGLVGYNTNSSNITNCFSIGDIFGSNVVGGLIGYNIQSVISNCYSKGSVKGNNNGGLIGNNINNSTIANSFSTANVELNSGGTFYIGGLVGSLTSSTITNSYSTGNVIGITTNGGGLVGQVSSPTINNSFYNIETSGRSDTGKGTPKTTSELKSLSTFTGWDFAGETSNGTDDIWAIASSMS
jgi:hypothetical protein